MKEMLKLQSFMLPTGSEIAEKLKTRAARNVRSRPLSNSIHTCLAAEHLAIEQDLIEMQEMDQSPAEYEPSSEPITEIDVDDDVKTEPQDKEQTSEGQTSPKSENGDSSFFQTKNGLVRAAILPVPTSQVSYIFVAPYK